MEQRKNIKLTTLLIRYALLCIIGVLGSALIWWMSLTMAINSGFVMPANSGEKAAQEAAWQLQEAGVFKESLVPSLCDYVFFANSGEVKATSLEKNKKALQEAINFKNGGYNSPDRYHILMVLEDGVCVLQYTFGMPYASKALRHILPDFQLFSIGVGAIAVIILLIGITSYYVKVLKQSLGVLEEAALQLKEGDLESSFTRSGIEEYDRTLECMEQLKTALRESLLEQWNMEHSLIAQTAALTHDLKTPLTVIDGNGQLLEETALSSEQRQCLEAIMRNVHEAQEYVSALSWMSKNKGASSRSKEEIEGTILIEKLTQTAQEICRAYGKQIEITFDEIPKVTLMTGEVIRAVANIIENAANYSDEDLPIRFTGRWRAPYLHFIIEDSGKGFTQEALENGTKLFYTENSSRTQNKHKGIGLAFAKSVAGQHEGELTLANTPSGHGMVTLSLTVRGDMDKN